MGQGRPILLGYNVLLLMMFITIFLYWHYFDLQDEMYMRIKKLEQQVESDKIALQSQRFNRVND